MAYNKGKISESIIQIGTAYFIQFGPFLSYSSPPSRGVKNLSVKDKFESETQKKRVS